MVIFLLFKLIFTVNINQITNMTMISFIHGHMLELSWWNLVFESSEHEEKEEPLRNLSDIIPSNLLDSRSISLNRRRIQENPIKNEFDWGKTNWQVSPNHQSDVQPMIIALLQEITQPSDLFLLKVTELNQHCWAYHRHGIKTWYGRSNTTNHLSHNDESVQSRIISFEHEKFTNQLEKYRARPNNVLQANDTYHHQQ